MEVDFTAEFVAKFLLYDTEQIIFWLDEKETQVDAIYNDLRPHFAVRFSEFVRSNTKKYLQLSSCSAGATSSSCNESAAAVGAGHTPRAALSVKRIGPCRVDNTVGAGLVHSAAAAAAGGDSPVRRHVRPWAAVTPSPMREPSDWPPITVAASTSTTTAAAAAATVTAVAISTPVSRRCRRRPSGSGAYRASSSSSSAAADAQLHELIDQASVTSRRRLRRLEHRLAPPLLGSSAVTVDSFDAAAAVTSRDDCHGGAAAPPAAAAVSPAALETPEKPTAAAVTASWDSTDLTFTPVKSTRAAILGSGQSATPTSGGVGGHRKWAESIDWDDVCDADGAVLRMARLFGRLVQCYCLADLAGELVLLVRLLTVAPSSGAGGGDRQVAVPFSSPANVVYFAATALQQLAAQLVVLDKMALRRLSQCRRVRDFSADLTRHLTDIVVIKSSSSEASSISTAASATATAASVVLDKSAGDGGDLCVLSGDLLSRPNFVDDRSFNTFRRQRDVLHQLVAAAASPNSCPGGCSCQLLADGACQLFGDSSGSCNRSPVNMYQVARLAVALLLQHSLADRGAPSVTSRGGGGGMASTPQQNRSGQQQQCKQESVCAQCERLGLHGVEHMFACLAVEHACLEFVLVWRDVLADSLLNLQLPEAPPPPPPLPSAAPQSSSSQQQQQQQQQPDDAAEPTDFAGSSVKVDQWKRVHGSCVLARQLALVTSVTSRWRSALSETVCTSWVTAKHRLPPVVDLLACVDGALRERRLCRLLPWLLVYLTLVDSATLLTAHQLTALKLLIQVRCRLRQVAPPSRAQLLLLLLYERLFQTHWRVNSSLQQSADLSGSTAASQLPSHTSWLTAALHQLPTPVQLSEQLQLLGEPPDQLVLSCVPRLLLVHEVLQQYDGLTGGGGGAGAGFVTCSPAVRRTVCVQPADLGGSIATPSTVDSTQLLLERAFFHCHNQCLRRIVPFLVERYSSSLVRHSRTRLLPRAVGEHMAPAHQHVLALSTGAEPHTEQQLREVLHRQLERLSVDRHAAVLGQVFGWCADRLSPLVTTCIGALLHTEQWSDQVRRMCCRLVTVSVQQKINNWLHTSITPDFLLRMMWDESRPFLRQIRHGAACDPDAAAEQLVDNCDEQLHSPAQLVIDLKYLVTVLDSVDESETTVARLDAVLSRLCGVCRQWCPVLPSVVSCVTDLTVQLVMTLIISRPRLLTCERCSRLTSYWQSTADWLSLADATARLLLSPPFISQLWQSQQQQRRQQQRCASGWDKLALVLTQMALVAPPVLSSCAQSCVVLLRQEWPQPMLDCLAATVRSVADSTDSSGSHDDPESYENQQWLLALAALMTSADFSDFHD